MITTKLPAFWSVRPLWSNLAFMAAVVGLFANSVCMFAQTPITYSWANFVGKANSAGTNDGTGSTAQFNQPAGVAVDGDGNVFVADNRNNTIRKVTPSGVVTTLAGVSSITNQYQYDPMGGFADGTGSAARFYGPTGVAVDSAGNIYVADFGNQVIRKISPANVVTTLAGNASITNQWGPIGGFADGTGRAARFFNPSGVAVDSAGNVFVADTYNYIIRKVTPAGVVTTLAGSPGTYGSADGTGSAARFKNPSGLTVDSNGNIYVADTGNFTIRKVTPAGVVTTLAGSTGAGGSIDGTGSVARFFEPTGVSVDSAGNVYVADYGNSTIRKVTPAGMVSTLVGSPGVFGGADGMGSAAQLNLPRGVAVDNAGNVYVADSRNNTLRKVTPVGLVTTLAGSAGGIGNVDGTGSAARFDQPNSVAVDSVGNAYVADTDNNAIRKVTAMGVVTTLAGGVWGVADGTGKSAGFDFPSGIAVDSAGNVYVADTSSSTIRKVTSAGVVTTLAGVAGPENRGSTDGTGSEARFNEPTGIVVDSVGNVYVADWGNVTIRKMTQTGVVTTLAGKPGTSGSADGMGSAARFSGPWGVAVDGAGNVYVTDISVANGNNTIRKVTPAGVVTTLVGSPGVTGSVDGTGTVARFNSPFGIAADNAGNIYVADSGNTTIRRVTPVGVVTTIGGVAGFVGKSDGIGNSARFAFPSGIAVDSAGTLYVADTANSRITKGTPSSQQPMVTISVYAYPSNSGTVSGGGMYPIASLQSISANANSGWIFTDWSDGNTQNPRTITVPTGGATYTANFSQATDTIVKLQLGLNFAKPNADSISLTAKLGLSGITNVTQLSGSLLVVDVGGKQVPFTLDKKGHGVSTNGTCVLTYTKSTKKQAGYWTVRNTLSKGNWHNQWASYGLNNVTHKSPGIDVTLPVIVHIGNETFAAEPKLHYIATFNKTGIAK